MATGGGGVFVLSPSSPGHGGDVGPFQLRSRR